MTVTVLLDVDGTLVDNSYRHTVAWWHACRDLDVSAEMSRLPRLIGMGGDKFVPALTGREMPELDEAHSRHYRPMLPEVPVLPGAADLIAELHRRGATVTIATSGNRADLDVLLGRIAGSRPGGDARQRRRPRDVRARR